MMELLKGVAIDILLATPVKFAKYLKQPKCPIIWYWLKELTKTYIYMMKYCVKLYCIFFDKKDVSSLLLTKNRL